MKMAEPVAQKPTPMHVFVVGRVEHRGRWEGKYITRVITPAPDAYSKPQLISIRSKQALGGPGEDVSITCKLGGYTRKAYETKDKQTGEILSVVPVDMTLDAIE
jgi:hypothetical protein